MCRLRRSNVFNASTKKPDDYVVATGKTNSVRTFIEKACNLLDIKIVWKNKGKKRLSK